ncbi:MAG: hypothetical protein DRG40_00985 [Deltaproteobacteria bacterium]|nr:MAG: hypothetical protein DRG40_00985 [Deltaproteobacteria bacterium]
MNNELIHYLVQKGYGWIVNQRNLHVLKAQELSEEDRIPLQPYFETEILFPRDQQSCISLLFHEIVHIVQYHLLGARQFAELYIKGWKWERLL